MTLTKQEIYDIVIDNDIDLYNVNSGQYLFHYNNDEAICCYWLGWDKAKELAEWSRESDGEYWGAFLGPGGWIYDDPWECIESGTCEEAGWIYCDDFLKEVKI